MPTYKIIQGRNDRTESDTLEVWLEEIENGDIALKGRSVGSDVSWFIGLLQTDGSFKRSFSCMLPGLRRDKSQRIADA
jgi:hypothetical protein